MKTQDSSVPLSPQQDSVMVKPGKVRPEPAVNTTRALLNALATLKSGDFSVRLPLDWVGIAGKVADTFNEVVALNQRMSRELGRLRESVGRESRINHGRSVLPRGKNRNSSLIGHTCGVALIEEKKHSPALLELPTWSIRLPWN
jgi:hypothetical protein